MTFNSINITIWPLIKQIISQINSFNVLWNKIKFLLLLANLPESEKLSECCPPKNQQAIQFKFVLALKLFTIKTFVLRGIHYAKRAPNIYIVKVLFQFFHIRGVIS